MARVVMKAEIDDSRMLNDDSYVELKELQVFGDTDDDLAYSLMVQGQLIGNVGVRLALALEKRDHAKWYIDVVEATLDRDLRLRLTENGEKFTEPSLAALIKLEPDYQKAYRRYFDLKYRADCWEALRESYRSRGYSMNQIAQLRTGDYQDQFGAEGRIREGGSSER